MSTVLAPPFIYLLAALIFPFLPSRVRALVLLGVQVLGLMVILAYPMGDPAVLSIVGLI